MRNHAKITFNELGMVNASVMEPVYQVHFEPEKWTELGIAGLVDCYTYVLDIPSLGSNSLGCVNSHENEGPGNLSIDDAKVLVKRDQLAKHETLPNDGSHVIAVFYSKNAYAGQAGIHAYRRDSNGLWSHLFTTGDCSAGGEPSQLDFSGNEITDPMICNRGPYNEFVGYYSIPYEGILVRPKLLPESAQHVIEQPVFI